MDISEEACIDSLSRNLSNDNTSVADEKEDEEGD
jgi:hypothetical protein